VPHNGSSVVCNVNFYPQLLQRLISYAKPYMCIYKKTKRNWVWALWGTRTCNHSQQIKMNDMSIFLFHVVFFKCAVRYLDGSYCSTPLLMNKKLSTFLNLVKILKNKSTYNKLSRCFLNQGKQKCYPRHYFNI